MIVSITQHKIKLLFLIFGCLSVLFCRNVTHAQTANVPVTGFNEDFVADGTGSLASASTTSTFGNYVVVSSTFGTGATACGTAANTLPANNEVTSTNTTNNTGITYTLQSYGNGTATNNNVLMVDSAASDTLTLVNPVSAATLYLVCMGFNNYTVTIIYTDGTSETTATMTMPNWCSGASTYRLTGVQLNRIRVDQTNCGTCPYLFEIPVAISPVNYSKLISSIAINNITGQQAIFAVGMKAPCTAPAAPTALSFAAPTYSNISGSFTASVATGYVVVRYPSGSAPATPVDGTTYTAGMSLGAGTVVSAGATNSFTATGLSAETTYDFYVYGYNDNVNNCGGPVYSVALTGSQATTACGLITGTTPDTVCAGTQEATLQAAANAGTQIKWYAAATGGTALGTGNSFTTPVLNATTSYYAEGSESTPAGYAGRGNVAATGTYLADGAGGYGLQFNALSTINIDSVAVWADRNSGTFVIQVKNSSNATLMTKTITLSGMGGSTSNLAKVYIPLNFDVPAGTGYRLVAVSGTTVRMKRETSGVTGYPFTIPDAISLTSGVTNGGLNASYYYFFYEVHVSTTCVNATREMVTATVPHHPAITYNAAMELPNTTNTCTAPDPSITITDTTGVNTTPGTAPRIWYKKGSLTTGNMNALPATNDNTTDGWKWVESSSTASPYSFTIDHNKIFGGATAGDTIYYFVMAQNTNGTPAVNNASFASGYCPASVALDAAAFPMVSVANSYALLPHSATAVATASSTYSCGSGTTTLNTTTPIAGENVQWQSSASGANMWVDIAAATNNSYTTGTLTGDTSFRCVITDCANSVVATSNTIAYSVSNPQITGTTPDTVCAGNQAILQAAANAGTQIKWYAAATGGTVLATGNSFTTPVLNATTNYYAEGSNTTPAGYTGRGNSSGTSSVSGTYPYGVQFTANTDIRIDSVAVWTPANNGTFTIQVRSSGNTILETRTVTLNGMGGSSSNYAKVYIPLGFDIPAGNGYKLVSVSNTAMRRESAGVPPGDFPYTLPGVISITAGIANGTPDNTAYYYLYEVHVSTTCVNPTRQQVTATVTGTTVDITSASLNMECGATAPIALTANVPVTWTLAGGELYADASGTAYTGTTATDIFAQADNNRYVTGSYDIGGCTFSDSAFITVNNAPATMLANAAGAANTDSTVINGAAAGLHNDDCELMASVMPTGGAPVSGWLTGKVFMDASVQNTATGPYVTRHFELTPETNAATSNATVTLYFTQAEFDAYNTYVTANGDPAVNPLLPSAPGGNTDHILVDKFNAASGSPSPTNNNSAVAITPTSVTWDATNNWWAVTFPTTGFSGFFLHTNVTSTPLPIVWKNVSATLNHQKQAVINWSVAEKEAAAYHIQKSTDGSRFEKIATVNSKGNGNNAYSFTEALTLSGKAWYRIVQVGKNGKEDYSTIMELQNSSIYGRISIYPNPATQVLTVETEAAATYSIYDLQGKAVMKGNLQNGKNTLHVSGLAKGLYTIKIGDYNQKIVLQ